MIKTSYENQKRKSDRALAIKFLKAHAKTKPWAAQILERRYTDPQTFDATLQKLTQQIDAISLDDLL